MTETQPGDQASGKYGRGSAEGTVAEVNESGQLAIQSKGNEVKANASENNPAVHVARDGNDVAKRASALNKEASGEEGGEDEPASEDHAGTDQKEETGDRKEPSKDEARNGNEQLNGNSKEAANNAANGHAPKTEENGDKMGISGDKPKAEVGGKRPREEHDESNHASEEERTEAENGKETKKAKIDNGENTNGDAHAMEEVSDKNEAIDTEATLKKRPGRPKKSETEVKAPADGAESISARTRSKA